MKDKNKVELKIGDTVAVYDKKGYRFKTQIIKEIGIEHIKGPGLILKGSDLIWNPKNLEKVGK